MRAMIQHHLQALEMTTLAAERSRNRDVLLLAQRIAISQDDEIEVMRQWLERRGEKQPEARDTPNGIAPHQVHEAPQAGRSETLPHGMLTREQLTSLEDASAEDFDRLFLELMIQHHEGALLMVEEFFRQGGGGRDAETFEIASHVDSDQRVEIARMRRVLAELD